MKGRKGERNRKKNKDEERSEACMHSMHCVIVSFVTSSKHVLTKRN